MPPRPACICGECRVCRNRVIQTAWRQRKRYGIYLTAEQLSELGRRASLARWAKRKPPVEVEEPRPDVSDEELDRRALESLERRWNT